ncbi:LysR family transcriptional regulator [Pendulispora brunnea]|uniref:LysR family transcriptional regulator n=1 Tax=Pendulispora brunnea TaxID=2905690 RepID=A0ABZ2KCL9_9BACT
MFVFVRLVETGSFSRAAQELATSPATVSRRLSRLEEHLEVHLVHRTTRHFALTEAGWLFYERAREILRAVENAERSIKTMNNVAAGSLRVSASTAFGAMHLGPLLPEFIDRHPGLRVELILEDRYVDLVAEGFDVAVRIGGEWASNLRSRRLSRERAIVCAAPAYLDRRGIPSTPAELEGHTLLRHTVVPRWLFRVDGSIVEVESGTNIVCNNVTVLREAAIRGLGLAYLPHFALIDSLAKGELVGVLENYAAHEIAIDALYAPTPFSAAKVRAYIDFLVEKVPERLGVLDGASTPTTNAYPLP